MPAAVLVGWLVTALGNGIWQCATMTEPRGFGARALFQAYDFAQSILLGVAISGCMFGFERWLGPRLGTHARWVAWATSAAVAATAGVALLPDDLAGAASRLFGGQDSPFLRRLVCAGVALVVPAAFGFGRLLGQGWLRIVPVVLAIMGLLANQRFLVGDYAAVHLFVGTSAAMLLGAAFVGLPIAPPRPVGRAVATLLAALALVAALWPPPAAIVAPLGRSWTSELAAVLPRAWLSRRTGGSLDGVYEPGLAGGPVPPSGLRVAPENPVVILLTIDSLRADLLTDEYRDRFPNLHQLREDSVWFTHARSPGTQTAITLTSVMMGTYYSQQYWTPCHVPEGGGVRVLLAHEDDGVRFPELLARAGVPTVQYGQAIWLENEYGMTRGFSEQRTIAPVPGRPSTKGKWSTGADVLPVILRRLSAHGEGPLFLFFHDLDPHSPFDLGKVKKPPLQAYLSEVGRVDARIGKLRDTLRETGLDSRTVLILSSDHGEAFGEHGTSFHGQNLYEEQIRVPLLVRLPGNVGRVSDVPVTLMDLGPTVLDLFGLPTPGHFMGQSLVPLLAGQSPNLSRPIIAEGRLKQALVLPSGLKLIRNQKEGTFEIYDLNADPEERHNLYDAMGEAGPKEMQKLIAFFERHRIRRPGYAIPYRR